MAVFNGIPAVCDCVHGYGWFGFIEVTECLRQINHSMAKGSFLKEIQVQCALPKEHGALELLSLKCYGHEIRGEEECLAVKLIGKARRQKHHWTQMYNIQSHIQSFHQAS